MDSSSAVFDSFAKEQANVSAAVHELPSTLRQTTDTLGRVETFAELLGPTTAEAAAGGARARPGQRGGAPVRARGDAAAARRASARSCASRGRSCATCKPVSKRLAKAGPDLTQVFLRFNHFLNLLGYNPNGSEGPGQRRPARRATCSGWRG